MRALLPYTTAVLAIAAIYAGWVAFSRWDENRESERAIKDAEARAARRIVDTLGGGKLTILAFWAEPMKVRRGRRALVCYGVSNAKSVRIEPHIIDIAPALSRCLEVFPKRTTEYKLTTEGADGQTATGSIVLQVE